MVISFGKEECDAAALIKGPPSADVVGRKIEKRGDPNSS